MGLFGVANGIDGDLRPGLPSQMIEVHDPIRLLIIVEHFPEVLLATLKRSPETFVWFTNEWIHLVAVNPETKELSVFQHGEFVPYRPLASHVDTTHTLASYIEQSADNLPVLQLAR